MTAGGFRLIALSGAILLGLTGTASTIAWAGDVELVSDTATLACACVVVTIGIGAMIVGMMGADDIAG